MVIENRPFGVRTSVIIEAKTLRCQNINKLIYFDGKTDLTQTREKITCVRGNQAGINAFLVPHELQYATAVPPLWGYHIAIVKHGSTSPRPEGCRLRLKPHITHLHWSELDFRPVWVGL